MMELRVDSGMAGMRLIVPRGGIGPGYDPMPGERIHSRDFPGSCHAAAPRRAGHADRR